MSSRSHALWPSRSRNSRSWVCVERDWYVRLETEPSLDGSVLTHASSSSARAPLVAAGRECRLVVVPAVTHFMSYQTPDAFNEVVLAF